MRRPPFDPDAAAPQGSGIYGLSFTPEESRVVVVPVPFEATTSYRGGTSRGPRAVLDASRQVDLFDVDTGRPWAGGIAMLPVPKRLERLGREAKQLALPIVEAGGEIATKPKLKAALRRVDGICEQLNAWVWGQTRSLLSAEKIPFVLGGDHSTPFGAITACAEVHPGMGILHVDAHADLREAYEGFTWSHASIMHNVQARIPEISRIVQVGLRDVGEAEVALIHASGGRIVAFFDSDLSRRQADGEPFSKLAREIASRLPETVYLSVDVDGLDPALAPHTGTPVPGGLSFQQLTVLLAAVVAAGRTIVGGDLCEVAPGPDGDEWDANVAARVLYKMIGFTLLSRERKGRRHGSRRDGR